MKKTLLTTGLVLIFLLGLVCSAYGGDTANITVTVEERLCIQYVPRSPYTDNVEFYIGVDDFNEGSQGIMNRGDMEWCANVETWRIKIIRTEWDASNGWGDHGTSDIHLQIKKGPIENTDWHTVTTTLTEWLTYEDMEAYDEDNDDGTGTFTGVDWKIKQIGWDDASPFGWLSPGVYTCTVTFTIVTP